MPSGANYWSPVGDELEMEVSSAGHEGQEPMRGRSLEAASPQPGEHLASWYAGCNDDNISGARRGNSSREIPHCEH